jgi:hypothetical protein
VPTDRDPADILGQPRARVMLLGTFRFADRGLDRCRPPAAFDVFSQPRQREIAELVDRMAGFGPTKVAVERTRDQQPDLDREYDAYRRGGLALPADEVDQLGFRLAARLGHARVWCANAWDRRYEGSTWEGVEAYARAHGQEHLLEE